MKVSTIFVVSLSTVFILTQPSFAMILTQPSFAMKETGENKQDNRAAPSKTAEAHPNTQNHEESGLTLADIWGVLTWNPTLNPMSPLAGK